MIFNDQFNDVSSALLNGRAPDTLAFGGLNWNVSDTNAQVSGGSLHYVTPVGAVGTYLLGTYGNSGTDYGNADDFVVNFVWKAPLTADLTNAVGGSGSTLLQLFVNNGAINCGLAIASKGILGSGIPQMSFTGLSGPVDVSSFIVAGSSYPGSFTCRNGSQVLTIFGQTYTGTGPYDGAPLGVNAIYLNVDRNAQLDYLTIGAAPTISPPESVPMTSPVLPISQLINVQVNLSPTAAAAQNLSDLLILGSSDVIDIGERYRVYSTLAGVAADFGTTLPEYLAALLWFEQVPQPAELIIGRWAQAAVAGALRGATLSAAQQVLSVFTAVSAGKFTYSKDGGGATTTPTINLSGALNLPAVAALVTAQTPGVVFTWNSNFQRFEAKSATTGASSAVTFLTTPGSGTDLSGILGMRADQSGSYTVAGSAAETAVNCVALFDLNYGMQFYGVTVLGAVNADHMAVGALLNATTNKHVYFLTTQEAGTLVAATTTDIAYMMKAAGYLRSFVQYSSSNPYAVVSAAARILTTDYEGNNTVITLMYKQEPGIVPENLNPTQAASLQGKNCNVFALYNNDTAIIQYATMANGIYADVVMGTDWLSLDIQTALYNLLYLTATKIPQTDAGANIMVGVVESVCDQGVRNGLLAAGTWTTTGFGTLKMGDFLAKGYYVYAPPVAQQNVSDRGARKAVPIQVAAKLAGAVHTIAMSINVNQ